MRKLPACLITAAIGGLCFIPISSSATTHKETPPWTLSRLSVKPIPSTPTDAQVLLNVKHQRFIQAQQLVSYANAVAAEQAAAAARAAQEATQAAAAARAQAGSTSSHTSSNSSSGIPASWAATAQCEEGGRNDPSYGYFGIKEWNGFGGYSSAGSAPMSVQLAWESAHGQGPPDAPGQCHSY